MPWQCHGNNSDAHSLRFIVHWEKPVIVPKHIIICLEFVISFTNMTLFLTDKKKTKIKGFSKDILCFKGETLGKFVEIIGHLVAGFLQ